MAAPRMFRLTPLALAAGLAGVLVAPSDASQDSTSTRVRYDGSSVVRVTVHHSRELLAALALTDDVWSHGTGIGSFDIRVTPQQKAALDASGIQYTVLIPDLQARIDAETARLAMAAEGGIAGDDWFADFKNLAQVNARMDQWAAEHPSMVSVLPVGTSFENRPIRAIRITRSTAPNTPTFLFNSCQHAREWATPMTSMYIAQQLIDGADTDPRIANILDRAAVIVVPVVNVDGYEFTWSADRMWRKNRQPNLDGSVGTDTNRNWGYQWGGQGASVDPGNDTYRGTAPFSAPEAAALRDFYVAHPEIVASIDIHSYSQLLMWPWAYTADLCPDDPQHRAIGLSMQYAMEQPYGTQYTAGPIYTTIYPASGGSVDWTYGDQGVLSFATEVRDTGAYGFIMPPEEIVPNAAENFAGELALIEGYLGPAVIIPNGQLPAALTPGEPALVSVLVTGTAGPVQNVNLRYRAGTSGPFISVHMNGAGDVYTGAIPPVPCGLTVQYWFEALGPGGQSTLPGGAPAAIFQATSQTSLTYFSDAMEGGTTGWTVGAAGDNATSGQWVRGDPVGTTAQPEDDHTANGVRCWVTGQGTAGGAAGTADIDGGTTTLTSPLLDGTHLDAELVYWVWYSNNLGAAPNADSMPVQFSTDGATWLPLETITQSTNAWVDRRIVLSSFLTQPGNFRIRFQARDLDAGSLVEAAVDDVSVELVGCPFAAADFNQDGVVDGADLGTLLGAWGTSGGASDLNVDGTIDGADLGMLLGMWG